eukprot:TRINITY_DN3586_c0_g2_i2.p1 TRINITY_DN3586_c0_g2~~TRINITY_DN3586_c0_g2_i2.p1  ORF type:complete len:312 (-),score=113.27 TRINITY_DN3586_c0_g2_i2:377-1312(-)
MQQGEHTMRKYVFVTVGTTNFDGLIKVVDTEEFRVAMMAKGYTGLLMQIGNTAEYVPRLASPLTNEKADALAVKDDAWVARYYKLKPSLQQDLTAASLVISHAGAGTIIDTLTLRRKMFVVVNTSLMDNHQLELAGKVDSLHLITLVPSECELMSKLATDPGAGVDTHGDMKERLTPSHTLQSILTENASRLRLGDKPATTMSILGSGGHTAEMLLGLKSLDRNKCMPFTYVMAAGDTLSERKVHMHEQEMAERLRVAPRAPHIIRIPRSRQVKQSYFTSIFTTLYACVVCFFMVLAQRPQLVATCLFKAT